jgi:sodium transport system permease protein
MRKIIVVAKKEFLDIFRDKRTLIRMILIPLLVFPLIMNIVTKIQSSQSQKQAEKELTVGYTTFGQPSDAVERMKAAPHYKLVEYSDTALLRSDVETKKINLGLVYPSSFLQDFTAGKQAPYIVYYRAADYEEYERFKTLLTREDSILVDQRMKSIAHGYDFIVPTKADAQNLSDPKEVIGKYAGGLLPYIFMAFLFMGCMLPAIDLFAGEKERGTIETLLTTPVNRAQILIGKMLVVTTFGLLSATVALVGLFASLNMFDMDPQLKQSINEILSPQLVVTLYLLLIPLALFFAGVMIPISVYSRSFKEAQSILTPLNIVMVLPAMAGFFPGVQLDYTTAFIPIVNVVLATKSIIAGNPDMVLIGITFFSLILLAGLSVFISLRQFGKESMILR